MAVFVAGCSSAAVSADEAAQARELQMTGQGRFTYFADLESRARDGDQAKLRALQLSDEPFRIGDVAYIGGWSNWVFDCKERMANRLDFSSLAENGLEGPATPTRAPAYPLSPGGDADELAQVACGEVAPRIDARTLDEARSLAQY